MIEITETAQNYFSHLLKQQDADDLALRIQVLQAGTPGAGCDLQFCPQGDQKPTDTRVAYDGFDLFIAASSIDWLQEALIDYETDSAGGQLTIKAPNIKGNAPDDGASLDERVVWVLNSEVNPRLASHGGQVALQEITPELGVVLRFGGGCHGCGMVSQTLQQGIETTLREHFPEITAVIDATDHDSGENPYYA